MAKNIAEEKKFKESGTVGELSGPTDTRAKSPEKEKGKNKEGSHLPDFIKRAAAEASLMGVIKSLSLDDLIELQTSIGEEDELDDVDDDDDDKKKKMAKKSDDDYGDEDDDDDKKDKKVEIKIAEEIKDEIRLSREDLSTDDALQTVFGTDETLSEEFKTQAKEIFETVLVTKVNEKLEDLVDVYEEKIGAIRSELAEDLEAQADKYLTYVAEAWLEENQIEVDYSIANEVSQSFMEEMKDVFERHYIQLPEDKVDVVEEMEELVSEMEGDKEELTEKVMELTAIIEDFQKGEIFESVCGGMVDTDKAKMAKLVENMRFDESFEDKLKVIAENFVSTKTSEINEEVDETPVLNEEEGAETLSPNMKVLSDLISRQMNR